VRTSLRCQVQAVSANHVIRVLLRRAVPRRGRNIGNVAAARERKISCLFPWLFGYLTVLNGLTRLMVGS